MYKTTFQTMENIFKTPYFRSNFQEAVILNGDSRNSTHFGSDTFGGDTPDKQVVQFSHVPQAWVIFTLFAHELAGGVAVSTAAQLVIGS